MSSSKVQFLLRVILPLVVGAVVIVWLFNGPLSFDDQIDSVIVESVDAISNTAIVRDASGASRVVPTASLSMPGAQSGATAQPILPGDRVEALSPGLISMAQRLPWWVPILVLALLFGALLLQVWRIWILMKSTGHSVAFGLAFQAHFVGLFYGNIIPAGQVGGDPIKALILSKRGRTPLSAAISAVAVDRGLGLLVLALIALVSLAAQINDPRYGDLIWWVGGFVSACAALLLLLMSRRLRRVTGLSWAVAKAERGKATGLLDALRTFRKHPANLIGACAISLLAQCLFIGAAIVVGTGLGVDQIGVGDYLALVPPASVVSALPAAAPGGWGIGEGAFVFLFGEVGVAAEAAFMISALPRLAIALLSLIGLPASLGRRKRDVMVDPSPGHGAVCNALHSAQASHSPPCKDGAIPT